MAFGILAGAAQHEHPLRHVRQRRPDLLPVDHPATVFCSRRSGYGQVGTGTRFRIARAHSSVTSTMCGRKRCFCSSVPNSIRVGPSSSSPRWLTRAGALARAYSAVEDDALLDGGAASAVAGRPAQAGPAGGGQVPVPGEAFGEEFVLATRTAAAGPAWRSRRRDCRRARRDRPGEHIGGIGVFSAQAPRSTERSARSTAPCASVTLVVMGS